MIIDIASIKTDVHVESSLAYSEEDPFKRVRGFECNEKERFSHSLRFTYRENTCLKNLMQACAHHKNTLRIFSLKNMTCVYDIRKKQMVVYMPDPCIPTDYYILRCIQLFYAYILLMEYDGLLLHSAGLAITKEAIAFCGPSDAGKSTIARAAKSGWHVYGDECNVIRPDVQGTYHLYPTPFSPSCVPAHAQYSSSAICRAIFFLISKGRHFEPVDRKDAAMTLANNVFIARSGDEPHGKLMQACFGITSRIPCRTFLFDYRAHLPTQIEHAFQLIDVQTGEYDSYAVSH
jgi:hypothetical protein